MSRGRQQQADAAVEHRPGDGPPAPPRQDKAEIDGAPEAIPRVDRQDDREERRPQEVTQRGRDGDSEDGSIALEEPHALAQLGHELGRGRTAVVRTRPPECRRDRPGDNACRDDERGRVDPEDVARAQSGDQQPGERGSRKLGEILDRLIGRIPAFQAQPGQRDERG